MDPALRIYRTGENKKGGFVLRLRSGRRTRLQIIVETAGVSTYKLSHVRRVDFRGTPLTRLTYKSTYFPFAHPSTFDFAQDDI